MNLDRHKQIFALMTIITELPQCGTLDWKQACFLTPAHADGKDVVEVKRLPEPNSNDLLSPSRL